MGEHLDESSMMFLGALDADDPERVAALAHIEGCARCRTAWTQSTELLALLDNEAQLPSVDPALWNHTRAAVASWQPPRLWRTARLWGWVGVALATLGLAWADANAGLHTLAPRIGVHCLSYELGFGAFAFVLGLGWARSTLVKLGPVRASFCALGGALAGQLLLHWRCPAEHTALHLLAFHVAGVALAGLLAAGVARLQQRTSGASAL